MPMMKREDDAGEISRAERAGEQVHVVRVSTHRVVVGRLEVRLREAFRCPLHPCC